MHEGLCITANGKIIQKLHWEARKPNSVPCLFGWIILRVYLGFSIGSSCRPLFLVFFLLLLPSLPFPFPSSPLSLPERESWDCPPEARASQILVSSSHASLPTDKIRSWQPGPRKLSAFCVGDRRERKGVHRWRGPSQSRLRPWSCWQEDLQVPPGLGQWWSPSAELRAKITFYI